MLIGESNPHGGDPAFALYPLPEGSAGWNLACVILGLSRAEYLRRFERRNLLAGPRWSIPEARRAALEVSTSMSEGDRAILLGARVAAAFSLEYAPFEEREFVVRPGFVDQAARSRFLILPHPSGRCRAWNEPGAFARARGAVESFLSAATTR
jgi:hypothetical protein